jgi:hypothetical protein
MLISTIEALIAIKKLYAYTLDTLKLKEYSLELTGTYQGKSKDAIQIDDDVEDMKVQCIINKEALTFAEVGTYFKDIIKFILLSGSGSRFVEMIESRIKYHLRKHHKTIKDLKVIKKVDQLLENAMKSVENLKPYKPSPDVAEASGNNGIYMTVASMMKEVSENEYISKLGNENFAKLLEDGKIIIVNTESFTMPINAMILDNVLHELSYRVKQSKKRAVTVVIDEANRVLSPESDLYTDILREAKGEIVMATQNHAQMIRKFGEIKWIQLSDNFLHQYYFSGKHKVSNMIKVLDEINGREFETEPYYFNQEELHAVEHEYQRMNHLYKEIVSENEHAIVLYDHQLYEHKNMLIKRDLETGYESMIEKEIHASTVKGVIENHLEFITSHTVNILNESIADH